MNVLALTPPGKLPTIIPDPGSWWSHVAALRFCTLVPYNANYAWWRVLCSAEATHALLKPCSFARRLRQRVEWRAHGLDLKHQAAAAGRALDALRMDAPYRSGPLYVETISQIADWLSTLNAVQDEVELSVNAGVQANGVDYTDSRSLADYAARRTLLSELIALSLRECPQDIDLLALSATSPKDLLTAMIAARCLRESRPNLHVCLVDHGYENFSLHPHVAALRTTGALERMFDTIILSKDERAGVLPRLVEVLRTGSRVKGFLTQDGLGIGAPSAVPFIAPAPTPIFCPTPILWTRLSERRCYWSRCTFCVQNAKYDNPRPPSRSEVKPTLDRIERLVEAGYRTFIFSDEALPPSYLHDFCDGVRERRLSFDWACRCKLELSHTPELFALMREAGCYEVLFGLESISPRVQRLMDKYVAGLDAARVREIFRSIHRAGIGLHVNLIAGFPSDTPEEALASVEFTIEALRELDGATFFLNRFELFPDTPIFRNPEAFGVVPIVGTGDMPMDYAYAVRPDLHEQTAAVERLIPRLRERLLTELGWGGLTDGVGPQSALALYSLSGHGSLMKIQGENNPFANPLRRPLQGVCA